MVETPFNFTGSKFKLLSQLLPEFDYTKETFVDVFCGGGSVYTNVVDKYKSILVNDVITDLIGIHKGLLEDDNIINMTKLICPDKTDEVSFSKLRNDYNSNPSPDKLWALMLSCTSNMMRFNQKFKFNQTFGKRSWNSSTDKKVEDFKNHIRKYKERIEFTSKTFYDLDVKPDTMYYLDPPYKDTGAGYNAYWHNDDEDKLYEYLKKIDRRGSSFVISGVLKHNNKESNLLKKLISDGYRHKELEFNYNKVSRVGKKQTTEIIIMNY
jgi:DNA adenine methylase Dam